jgi:uncharacterized protein (TIGR03435 family)
MTTRTPHHSTSRHFTLALAASLTLPLAATPALGQIPQQPAVAPPATSAPAPAFEVASVRVGDPHPAPLPPGASPISPFPTNRFFAHNVNLRLIIAVAFGTDERYVEGPEWLESSNYSIDAKVAGEQQLSYDQIKPLLQNLLAQRFGLKVHRESKLSAGFELVIAKGGPKLQPAKPDGKPWGQILPNRIDDWNTSIGGLASMLSRPAGQPVVDKTGLTGTYDFKLSYASANDPNSSLPDFFTALQEQLGLKLVPQKVLVDILVIDHVDKTPTDN